MAYSYKGAIQFGLIYIPIALSVSARSHQTSFHLIDKNTQSRIKYTKTCELCGGHSVANEDIIKAYEIEPNRVVTFTDDELEEIKSEKDKQITIEGFVKQTEIDPIYYDKTYYVHPLGGEEAFNLLRQAMEEEKLVGISQTVLGMKEKLLLIRPYEGRLVLTTLYYADELTNQPVAGGKVKKTSPELTLAKQLIRQMTQPFDIQAYHDHYQDKLLQAIQAKMKGQTVAVQKGKAPHDIGSLLDALQESLKPHGTQPRP